MSSAARPGVEEQPLVIKPILGSEKRSTLSTIFELKDMSASYGILPLDLSEGNQLAISKIYNRDNKSTFLCTSKTSSRGTLVACEILLLRTPASGYSPYVECSFDIEGRGPDADPQLSYNALLGPDNYALDRTILSQHYYACNSETPSAIAQEITDTDIALVTNWYAHRMETKARAIVEAPSAPPLDYTTYYPTAAASPTPPSTSIALRKIAEEREGFVSVDLSDDATQDSREFEGSIRVLKEYKAECSLLDNPLIFSYGGNQFAFYQGKPEEETLAILGEDKKIVGLVTKDPSSSRIKLSCDTRTIARNREIFYPMLGDVSINNAWSLMDKIELSPEAFNEHDRSYIRQFCESEHNSAAATYASAAPLSSSGAARSAWG